MDPGVGSVVEDLVDAGRGPGHLSVAGRHLQLGKPLRNRVGRELLLEQPDEHLTHRGCFGLVEHAVAGLAILLFDVGVAVGCGASEELPSPGRMQLTPPTTLYNRRPLEFGEQPLHFSYQPLLGGVVERAIGEHNRASVVLQFIDHYVLVGVVTRQPIRAEHQDRIQLSPPGRVAQLLQPRPIQPRATVALVDVAVLGREHQFMLSGVLLQDGQLALDRALFLLLSGRNASIDGNDFHLRPSSDRMDGDGDVSGAGPAGMLPCSASEALATSARISSAKARLNRCAASLRATVSSTTLRGWGQPFWLRGGAWTVLMAAPLTLVCAVRLATKCTGAMVGEVWLVENRVNPEGGWASVMPPPCSNGGGGLVAGSERSPHGTGARSRGRSATSRLYLRLHRPGSPGCEPAATVPRLACQMMKGIA